MPRLSPEERYDSYTEVFTTSVSSWTIPRVSRTYARSFYSETSPGYPRNKRWNPYSMLVQYGSRKASIHMYEYWKDKPQYGWGSYQMGWDSAVPSYFAHLDSATHDPDALLKCESAHMQAVSDRKVNLAQAFAERDQTVRLITDTAKKLASMIRHLRKGNLSLAARAVGVRFGKRSSRRNLDTLSEQWLALQYGWKPLLSDVYGAAELLAQRHFSRPPRLVILTRSGTKSIVNDGGWFYQGYSVPGTLKGITTTKVRMESVYEISNQFIRDGGQTGIIDPLTLAWELLPYSFIVDWFIPVGQFVANLNYDAGLSFVSRLQTQYTVFTGTVSPVGHYEQGGYLGTLVRDSSGSFSSNAIRVDRAVVGPVLASPPKFKDPFSPTHCLNAIALMNEAFKRSR